jgi:Homeodomain-like domain
VTAKQTPRRKYLVKLSDEERERLTTLIQTGKHRARQLLKARILLKADASDAGAAWSDNQIAQALEISVDTVGRTRRTLVEEGLDAALTRQAAHLRWRCRSQVERIGMFHATKGPRAMDAEAAGVNRRGTEHR